MKSVFVHHLLQVFLFKIFGFNTELVAVVCVVEQLHTILVVVAVGVVDIQLLLPPTFDVVVHLPVLPVGTATCHRVGDDDTWVGGTSTALAFWLVFALALTRVNLGLFADDTVVTLGLALPRAVLADEVIPVVDEHTVVVVVGVGDDTLVAYGAVVVGVVDSRHRGQLACWLVACLFA